MLLKNILQGNDTLYVCICMYIKRNLILTFKPKKKKRVRGQSTQHQVQKFTSEIQSVI